MHDRKLRLAACAARFLGLAVVGVLVFLGAPGGALETAFRIACYTAIALAAATWTVIDLYPAAEARRSGLLLPVLCVLAAAGGFGSTLSQGDSMVAFAVTAVLAAGSDLSVLGGWAVLGSGVLGIETGSVAFGDDIGSLLGYPLLLLVGLLAGRNRRAYRMQAEQSAAMLLQYEQLQAEQRRSEVLDERTRIAREIHDVLAHSLGALSIQIQVARAVLTDDQDVDRAVELLTAAQRMTAEGLVETRRAVHALRTDALPLDREVARAAGEHARRHGTEVGVDVDGEPRTLPADATVALLRIAQEALVNAAKHAAGQPVAVRLGYTAATTRLTVSNALAEDGPAVRPAGAGGVHGGYGLIGMRERLRLLGGTLAAGPQDGRWTVTAELPHAGAQSAPRSGKLVP